LSNTEIQEWYNFPWGANWCARRQALLEIGGFRTRYGRIKRNYGGGEEIVAASLIQKIGYTIAILPQSKVNHMPDVDRYSFKDVSRTIRAGLMVYYQMQRDLYIPLFYTFSENVKTILADISRIWTERQETSQAKKIEHRYRLFARFNLIWIQIGDLIRKYRSPITKT